MKLKIREIRREKAISVAQLAKIAGVTTVSIYRYEEGTREPTFGIASKMAAALGVTIDELLGNGEKEKPA